MKYVLAKFALVWGLLIVMHSCKKDSATGASQTEIITANNWKLISYTISTISGTTDIYSTYTSCRKDDYLHFNKNGAGEMNEGSTKCNSGDPQSQFIQWAFMNNEDTKIQINGNDYVIDKLDDNNFQIHSISADPFAAEEWKAYIR